MKNENKPPDEIDLKLTAFESEAIQQWAKSPAPGEDRLKNTSAPPLPAKTSARPARRRPWLYQAAAGIALFFIGYLAGTTTEKSNSHFSGHSDSSETTLPVIGPNSNNSNTENVTAQLPTAPAIASDNQIASAPDTPRPSTTPTPTQKDCPTPQVYQGTDGRFRINTTLCETGSHATWIINPKLELAKAPTIVSEETQ